MLPSWHPNTSPSPGPTPTPTPNPNPNPHQVAQACKVEVHGKPLNGKLTCGENIADLGGLKLAYKALLKAGGKGGKAAAGLINGFTPTQRFFLAWAQLWRGMAKVCLLGIAPARLLRLLRARLAAPGGSRRPGREAHPLGAQPLPRVHERAASKAAHFTTSDHVPGGVRTSLRSRPYPYPYPYP